MKENQHKLAGVSSSARGYDSTAKWLHWLVVVLVLTQFVVAIFMPHIGRDTMPGPLINLHLSLGVVILLVIAVRLFRRLRYPVALGITDLPAWERAAAYLTHVLFYVILVTGPVLGWASASAHSLPVTIFGVVRLPDLVAPKASIGLEAGDIHAVMMWTLLALIGLHAAAALYHHFIRHDGVLQRMLPGRAK